MTPGNNYYIPRYNSKNSNNRYFIPKEFKEKISTMNPLFEGAQANDAKDLVNFLIMTLHEELNKAPKIQNINSSNLLINQSNKQDVFNNFILTFARENISLISDLFYAVNNNITECLNCGHQKYNYQIYFFLNFPLEEVRKFKIDNNQFIQANQIMMSMNPMFCQQNFINNNQIINSVNLDDCFRYNQKIENFSGENSMYCNNCQTQSPAVYKTILTTGPEILIIILNRGKGIQFKVKCEFVSQLNLYEYIEMKNTGFMYDLIGVVTHIGEHGPSGHFIAYCRSPIDNNWYQYNDDLVFPVKDFVNEVINYAMPYILFYQKIK
jgi:ubiquitin C-terminal hydrolase